MGSAFHFMTNSGVLSTPYGGIIPDPITLGESEVMIDGQKVIVSGTVGQKQYLIVEPGDYPMTEDARRKRAGSVRK